MKRIFVGKIAEFSKTSGNKTIAIQPSEGDRSNKLCLVLDGGGKIFSWGLDLPNKDNGNKTYLSFQVNDPGDIIAMRAFDDKIKKMSSEEKGWWPDPDDEMPTLKELNHPKKSPYNPLLKPEKKVKKGDGEYKPICKVGIPVDDSGEVLESVRIKDADGTLISLKELPGREWSRVVIRIPYLYFKGATGFGVVKKLEYIKVNEGGGNAGNPDDFDEIGLMDDATPVAGPDLSAPAAGAPQPPGGPTGPPPAHSLDELDALLEAPADVEQPRKKKQRK